MTAGPILRNSLVTFTLASVGLPVAVIGVAAWFVMSYRLDIIDEDSAALAVRIIMRPGVEGTRHPGHGQPRPSKTSGPGPELT